VWLWFIVFPILQNRKTSFEIFNIGKYFLRAVSQMFHKIQICLKIAPVRSGFDSTQARPIPLLKRAKR
jgi:hypothetical protein